MLVVKQRNGSPRMAEHHVERVHMRDADMGQQVALIAPVDLSLRTRDDFEATVRKSLNGFSLRSQQVRRRCAA